MCFYWNNILTYDKFIHPDDVIHCVWSVNIYRIFVFILCIVLEPETTVFFRSTFIIK